jgi:hypothetical protein
MVPHTSPAVETSKAGVLAAAVSLEDAETDTTAQTNAIITLAKKALGFAVASFVSGVVTMLGTILLVVGTLRLIKLAANPPPPPPPPPPPANPPLPLNHQIPTPNQVAFSLATERLRRLCDIARRMAIHQKNHGILSTLSIVCLHFFNRRYHK